MSRAVRMWWNNEPRWISRREKRARRHSYRAWERFCVARGYEWPPHPVFRAVKWIRHTYSYFDSEPFEINA